MNDIRVNFSGWDLHDKDLSHMDLTRAKLCGTNLSFASLYGAKLDGARIDERTNLYGADLREAEGIPFVPMVCPSEGPFMAWKVALDSDRVRRIVKLLIPARAKRVSGTVRACRCSEAYVIRVEGAPRAYSINDPNICYEPGKYVYPDRFDEDRWDNYGHGIYFFIDREEAERYKDGHY